MTTHNCPACGGPACNTCGHRLSVINEQLMCKPCLTKSLREYTQLAELFRTRWELEHEHS